MMKKYLNLFNISPETAEKLIRTAMSSGSDFADLYFEHSVASGLLLRDGEVCTCSLKEDYGTGIRAVSGEKTGYSYCESTDPEEMNNAAKAASAIGSGLSHICTPADVSKNGISSSRHDISTRHGFNTAHNVIMTGTDQLRLTSNPMKQDLLYPVVSPWTDCPVDTQIQFLKGIETRIYSADSRVKKIIARASWSNTEILMYNSLGEWAAETAPLGSVSVTAILDGFSNSVSRSFRIGAELLNEMTADEICNAILKNIDEKLEARRPKGGIMPVVIGAGAGGILLHEAMGHSFEADFNRKGQSIFSDMMGKRICREGINIVDDGTIPGNRGSCLYDDEGVPGQKTYMVTDGVLTSYLHDRISARHYGVSPTGNGLRESFRYNPIPRMRATYMENGAYSKEEIISSVKKGIYVDEFSNGQVKIGEGDFTFYVESGFLIEDGKLTMPVKDINISGNGPEALADISMVGNDLKIDNGTWICGKEQSVAVSCGIPTVLVDKLTVGGE